MHKRLEEERQAELEFEEIIEEEEDHTKSVAPAPSAPVQHVVPESVALTAGASTGNGTAAGVTAGASTGNGTAAGVTAGASNS